mmetsp:Transcript_9685/g.24054  ORF Transcript_9685/g.24054 Transcript_9685/m.24054 type:complete len:243 (-) Transcript_9685:391-1119(-)
MPGDLLPSAGALLPPAPSSGFSSDSSMLSLSLRVRLLPAADAGRGTMPEDVAGTAVGEDCFAACCCSAGASTFASWLSFSAGFFLLAPAWPPSDAKPSWPRAGHPSLLPLAPVPGRSGLCSRCGQAAGAGAADVLAPPAAAAPTPGSACSWPADAGSELELEGAFMAASVARSSRFCSSALGMAFLYLLGSKMGRVAPRIILASAAQSAGRPHASHASPKCLISRSKWVRLSPLFMIMSLCV